MGLLPRDVSFFDDFERHGRKTVQGCREFLSLLGNIGDAPGRAQVIKTIEEECDAITHAVVARLHTTFITPIDRNDIYRLITKMDDVMDYVEAAAERISLFEIRRSTQPMEALARNLLAGTEQMLDAVSGLRNLKSPRMILDRCVGIARLEKEADAILRTTIANLFRDEYDPVEIVKWKELYEFLEIASDRCDDVANVIEGIVLENA